MVVPHCCQVAGEYGSTGGPGQFASKVVKGWHVSARDDDGRGGGSCIVSKKLRCSSSEPLGSLFPIFTSVGSSLRKYLDSVVCILSTGPGHGLAVARRRFRLASRWTLDAAMSTPGEGISLVG